MRYGSVCSGIEAATAAWHPLGWQPQFFSEIEPFPCSVLAHHYPDVPNYGDMTNFKEWPDAAIDVLVGGTPCQSYSVAGLRAGLDDPRGDLMLTYVAVARKYRPRWVVWENVPGVLSSNKGRDFGSFLGLLTGQHIECPPTGWQNSGVVPGYKSAYGIAWRVLDAQFAGVPQRRRRVFVVGYLGDWRRAAAVFFERHSLQGHSPPSRKAGQAVAPTLDARAGRSGETSFATIGGLVPFANAGYFGTMKEVAVADSLRAKGGDTGNGGETLVCGTLCSSGKAAGSATQQDAENGMLVAFGGNNMAGPIDVATACNAKGGSGRMDFETETFVTHTLRGEGFDASEDGPGRGTPLIPVYFQTRGSNISVGDVSGTLGTNSDRASGSAPCIAFSCKDYGADAGELSPTLRAMNFDGSHANGGGQVAVAFAENSRAELRLEGGDGSRCGALSTGEGKPGQGVPMVFNLRGREGGAMAEMAEMASLRAASGGSSRSYVAGSAVRRLTPRECERLQGFPDDFTLIPSWQKIKNVRPEKLDHDYLKYLARGGVLTYEQCIKAATDGPRYKALGNSMNRECMEWIGKRIQMVNDLDLSSAATLVP